MNLVALALRAAARQCLLDRTWAGPNVWDQPTDPVSEVLRGQDARPGIAIYGQGARREGHGLDSQAHEGSLDLRVFVYAPPGRFYIGDLEIDAGSQAGAVLDIVSRQAAAALHIGNETWLSVFRGFVTSFAAISKEYILVELEDGVRVPACELRYEMRTVAEPEYGVEIFGAWAAFDAALRATALPDAIVLADVVKASIESPADLPEWRQFQAAQNLSDAALEASGLKPLILDEGELVEVDEITIDVSFDGVADEDS